MWKFKEKGGASDTSSSDLSSTSSDKKSDLDLFKKKRNRDLSDGESSESSIDADKLKKLERKLNDKEWIREW